MVLLHYYHLVILPMLRISSRNGMSLPLITDLLWIHADGFSLIKDANLRPTYAQLLEHPFLAADKDAEVDMVGWVAEALERRASRGVKPLALVEA